jgi:hypothetical protein
MPHCTDPFVNDPFFRDPPVVDRYGRPISRRKWSGEGERTRWTWAIVGIAAMLLVLGFAFGPFAWDLRNAGPELAATAASTIGQGR